MSFWGQKYQNNAQLYYIPGKVEVLRLFSPTSVSEKLFVFQLFTLMSRIERKYCSISISSLVGFVLGIVFGIW